MTKHPFDSTQPCMFCGGTKMNMVKNVGYPQTRYVECETCRCQGPHHTTTDGALWEWTKVVTAYNYKRRT